MFSQHWEQEGVFFLKKAAEKKQHSTKSFSLTLLITKNLVFMTLYTINEFAFMKNSFAFDNAHFCFPYFFILLQQISFSIYFGDKLRNQLRKTGKYWNAVLSLLPVILHCPIFSILLYRDII